ncbi:MAG TPA: hypothetical protein VJ044_03550 [Candidatus Hodarchaeales archaeon]|nr:hypothetical protein [Candidatus Hodarchaeales archaeon]
MKEIESSVILQLLQPTLVERSQLAFKNDEAKSSLVNVPLPNSLYSSFEEILVEWTKQRFSRLVLIEGVPFGDISPNEYAVRLASHLNRTYSRSADISELDKYTIDERSRFSNEWFQKVFSPGLIFDNFFLPVLNIHLLSALDFFASSGLQIPRPMVKERKFAESSDPCLSKLFNTNSHVNSNENAEFCLQLFSTYAKFIIATVPSQLQVDSRPLDYFESVLISFAQEEVTISCRIVEPGCTSRYLPIEAFAPRSSPAP